MTLVRGQIQAAQLRPQASDGATEIVRMDAQIINQAARMAARQRILETRPIAPVGEKQTLLFLLGGAIVFVGSGQGQTQGILETPLHQQASDELAALAGDRAETLIV